MRQVGVGWGETGALHQTVARRTVGRPRRVAWPEVRDLALMLTLTTAGPLSLVALGAHARPAAVFALSAVTAAAWAGLAHVFRRDYLIDLTLAPVSAAHPRPGRWRRVALRLIPGAHRPTAAPAAAAALLSPRAVRRP